VRGRRWEMHRPLGERHVLRLERQPRMLQFLAELEENAVQLDRMNKGAKISSVAGSSVGAVGGVLSIVGLALIPFTAGVSLGLTMTGMGLGVTSGVNSIVTTATEIGVNRKHQKKASEVFQSFTEDVEIDVALGVFKILFKANGVVAQEGKALGNVPRVASDIPDIGQAAVKGPLALTKSARAGLIAVNALFLGMDIFFICKDSITLAKDTLLAKCFSQMLASSNYAFKYTGEFLKSLTSLFNLLQLNVNQHFLIVDPLKTLFW
uniref:Uncharacterized protein n=1 Tax=Anabas testudineus TaxID=64144 RepID=A0AAQ6ITX5_ANATE